MRPGLSLALAASVALVSTGARADDAAHAEAKRRMAEGSSFYNDGQFEEARLRFAEACTLMHSFNCVRSLAAAEYRSGHLVQAFDHLHETINDPKFSGLPSDTQREFLTMRADALKQTGHIRVSAPDGATVFVDEALIGAAPLSEEITVTLGRHVVEAKTTGGTLRVEVDAVGGQFTSVQLRPEPSAPGAPVPSNLPSEVAAPSTGHLESTAQRPWTEPPGPEYPAFWSSRRVIGALVAGAGVASVITGVGFGIAAQNDASQVESLRIQIGANATSSNCMGTASSSQCPDLLSARDAQAQHHTLNLAFVATGAAVVAVGAGLFLWPDPSKGTRAVLQPIVTPQFGGVVLRGTL